MNLNKTKKTIIFAVALAMVLPAMELVNAKEAQAFGILSSSRKSGKRTHKQSDSKKKSDSKTRRSSQAVRAPGSSTTRSGSGTTYQSSPSTTTRNRTTYRSTPTTTTQRRTVYRSQPSTSTRTRVYHRTPATTTTTRRRVYTTRPAPNYNTRSRVVHRRHYAPVPRTTTRTEVHHHHTTAPRTTTRTEIHHHHTGAPVVVRPRSTRRYYYYGSGDTSGGSTVTGTYQGSNNRRSYGADDRTTEAYITAGAGLSGMAAPQIANDALPGMSFNAGLGAKSSWMAGELGFTMGGYRLDPAQAQSDMTLIGVSADLKLQPSFAFLEPYALVGVAGEYFNDTVVNQSATGGALRLGAGVDVRISDVALSAQYLYTQHGLFSNGGAAYEDGMLSAATETIGLGLKLYF